MVDDLTCAHCGGSIDEGTVCSETCRLIAEEGYWPSPVGPATHDEMVGWIEAERARAADQASAEARAAAEAIAEKRRREQPVSRGDLEDLMAALEKVITP
jgi:hypothetical protein